ncbi:hypothetical protein HMPREF9946_03182 [Acetobacteraceae bacterium AT-5844]|nr:hypothetical protein HMPREF9946_03182 [Acetobacteraceae bacterium AT-5844]
MIVLDGALSALKVTSQVPAISAGLPVRPYGLAVTLQIPASVSVPCHGN